MDQAIWDVVHRQLKAMFSRDFSTYEETAAEDLSLYEWFVTPHRLDGLDFHRFMTEHNWAGTEGNWRYDLLEPRLQHYGDTAICTYTLMLSRHTEEGITHTTHNESRVLVQRDGAWRVVHVHKSPAWNAPLTPEPWL